MNKSIYGHPYVEIVRAWSLRNGLDLDRIEDSSKSNSISWTFNLGGIPTLIMFYEYQGEYFFWIQGILAKLDNRNALQVTKHLLHNNFEFHHPIKFSLDPDKQAIVLMMRSCLEWLTEDHINYRLDTFGKLALEAQESLKRDFGLRSFLDSWFSLPK